MSFQKRVADFMADHNLSGEEVASIPVTVLAKVLKLPDNYRVRPPKSRALTLAEVEAKLQTIDLFMMEDKVYWVAGGIPGAYIMYSSTYGGVPEGNITAEQLYNMGASLYHLEEVKP